MSQSDVVSLAILQQGGEYIASKLLRVPATVNGATCRWPRVLPSILACSRLLLLLLLVVAVSRGLLAPAPTRSSSETDEQLGGRLIAAEAAPPRSWQTEKRLLTWLLAAPHPAIVFHVSITTQPVHLPLFAPWFCFLCMQVFHRED